MLKSKDLSLLHDFSVVCREGNLTKAARELNTVQSGITQRMQRLEQALGTQLLKRHSRGVSPTEQGLILLKYAERLDALIGDASAEVGAWEDSPSGNVSIGLPPSVSAVLTTPLIAAVNHALPNVELTVAEAFSGYLEGWLNSGEIDFAFIFDRLDDQHSLITPLVEEELYLITTPQAAKNLPECLTINNLADLPLIAPTRRHALRTDVEKEAVRRGVKLEIVLELDAGHQLIRQIERGLGSSVLARSAVMPELKSGKLLALPIIEPVFRRKVCLAVKHDQADSYLLAQVKQVIESVVAELVAEKNWPGVLLVD